MGTEISVQVRRIYEPRKDDDGSRILVDRLWPRGMTKHAAALDEWLREVAPSNGLRRWYGHRPERYQEFTSRYEAELDEPQRLADLAHLVELAQIDTVTLLTATKNVARSHVPTLLTRLLGTTEADILVHKV